MSGKLRLSGSTSGYIELQSEAAASNATLTIPNSGFGKILQVVTTEKTDAFSNYGQTFFDITGMSASITPASISNKILVLVHMPISVTAAEHVAVRLVRGSEPICIGDADSNIGSSLTRCSMGGYITISDVWQVGIAHIDTPFSSGSPSSVTYKMQGRSHGNDSIAINRNGYTANDGYTLRWSSSITLMEIGA